MSISPETVVALIDDHVLSLEQLLRTQQLEGSLLPAIHRSIVRQIIHQRANEQRFVASEQHLQRAADRFRRKYGLLSAAQMQQWLDNRQLSLLDFQAILETDLERQFVITTVTSNAEKHFDLNRTDWNKVHFRKIEVGSEQLAEELKCQLLEDGIELPQFLAELPDSVSADDATMLHERFHATLPSWLRDSMAEARDGSLIGPLASPSGWALIVVETVTPAVFDLETEAAIRRHLFQDWLSARIRNSTISYPVLDLLSCSNDS